jgi:hypothetical protein
MELRVDMKTVRAWSGYDSYGRSIEVAERLDGKFFWREYEYNGWGKAWSKWKEHTPSFSNKTTNVYSDEVVYFDTPQLFWGFNQMSPYVTVPKFRLPKEV